MKKIQVIRNFAREEYYNFSVGYVLRSVIRYTPHYELTRRSNKAGYSLNAKHTTGNYISMFIISAVFALALITMLNQKGF